MSPIPPNKDLHKSNEEESINPRSLNEAANNDDDSEFEVIDANSENFYEPISQDSHYVTATNDDGDDDDDGEADSFYSEDDNVVEIDPDQDFELLASSRVSQTPANPSTQSNSISYNNSNLLEHDVFERKNALECEDIQLDDSKTQKINSLMSGFQLPDSAVPEWAKLVPENVWKKNLLDSLNAKKTDLFNLKQ